MSQNRSAADLAGAIESLDAETTSDTALAAAITEVEASCGRIESTQRLVTLRLSGRSGLRLTRSVAYSTDSERLAT